MPSHQSDDEAQVDSKAFLIQIELDQIELVFFLLSLSGGKPCRAIKKSEVKSTHEDK